MVPSCKVSLDNDKELQPCVQFCYQHPQCFLASILKGFIAWDLGLLTGAKMCDGLGDYGKYFTYALCV
jgi:hypothetical protein